MKARMRATRTTAPTLVVTPAMTGTGAEAPAAFSIAPTMTVALEGRVVLEGEGEALIVAVLEDEAPRDRDALGLGLSDDDADGVREGEMESEAVLEGEAPRVREGVGDALMLPVVLRVPLELLVAVVVSVPLMEGDVE